MSRPPAKRITGVRRADVFQVFWMRKKGAARAPWILRRNAWVHYTWGPGRARPRERAIRRARARSILLQKRAGVCWACADATPGRNGLRHLYDGRICHVMPF